LIDGLICETLVHFANNMPKTPYSTLLYIALDTLSQPNTTFLLHSKTTDMVTVAEAVL